MRAGQFGENKGGPEGKAPLGGSMILLEMEGLGMWRGKKEEEKKERSSSVSDVERPEKVRS